MKIFHASQIKEIDQATTHKQSIASIELMERACEAFVASFMDMFRVHEHPSLSILCGQGNNGGDGLGIARLLHGKGYDVAIYILDSFSSSSDDFNENLSRLSSMSVPCKYIRDVEDMPVFDTDELIVDAILGVGLDRPLTGLIHQVVDYLNKLPNVTLSVDIPTGLSADSKMEGLCIYADHTFTFDAPKCAFMFEENADYVGDFHILDIGLDADVKDQMDSANVYLDISEVQPFFKKREKFAHKGVFGHALLIAGSHGKIGAAVLASQSCLRSGVGLLTTHVPSCGYSIMQSTVPEAMVSVDEDEHIFTRVYDLQKYAAIGIGCGLSTKNRTRNALCYVLKNISLPVVLDADALNILGQNPDWFQYVPKDSILTPHPVEFERMFGRTDSGFEQLELQRAKSIELGVYIVLKGAHSSISTPEGTVYFNATGNPGMGTAGSGDVLTGIVLGLLSQRYSPSEAVKLGVLLHGLAGDHAADNLGEEFMLASDITGHLHVAFKDLS